MREDRLAVDIHCSTHSPSPTASLGCHRLMAAELHKWYFRYLCPVFGIFFIYMYFVSPESNIV